MGKSKINKAGWGSAPNAFYVAAMRKTDDLNGGQETENQQWLTMSQSFHHAFQTLDDAYQRSMVSFSTQTIAEKDEERDVVEHIRRVGVSECKISDLTIGELYFGAYKSGRKEHTRSKS